MFIERLLNQGNAPLLEQTLRFTEARHRLLTENVVNVDTPGYRQRDMSLEGFQSSLASRAEERAGARTGSVGFSDIQSEIEQPNGGILFHDGNNRSMEQLMSDSSKNVLLHNLVVELLRKQFNAMEMALKERVT